MGLLNIAIFIVLIAVATRALVLPVEMMQASGHCAQCKSQDCLQIRNLRAHRKFLELQRLRMLAGLFDMILKILFVILVIVMSRK